MPSLGNRLESDRGLSKSTQNRSEYSKKKIPSFKKKKRERGEGRGRTALLYFELCRISTFVSFHYFFLRQYEVVEFLNFGFWCFWIGDFGVFLLWILMFLDFGFWICVRFGRPCLIIPYSFTKTKRKLTSGR